MDTQNSSLKLRVFVSQNDPVSSWNMVWKDYQGQAWLSLCIPGLRDVVSIFCWFCEAVAPAMQDIRSLRGEQPFVLLMARAGPLIGDVAGLLGTQCGEESRHGLPHL